MVDEIQIGVDASQGINALDNFTKAFDRVLRAGGATGSHISKEMGSAERSIANLSKQMVEADRVIDRTARKQRVMAEFGVKQNSKGQFITAKGQFASAAQTAGLRERLEYIDRVGDREAALERMSATNAENARRRTMAQMADFSQKIQELGPSARYALYDVAQTATMAGTAILGMGVAAVGFATAHERAFANVKRTTQTSEQGYSVIQRQLELMAMTLPVSFKELTNIASAAGQLGISAGGIKSFTETVAKLSATTNLSSDAAGTALARFKAFFAEAKDPSMAVTEATFSNLASSILKVGINSIATETGIVNVSTQIASMGKYAGFVAHEVIGLAGALSSVGVAPELARGLTTRMFTIMGNAVSDGGVRLEKFAKLSGTSAAEFKKSWDNGDMAGTFTRMLQGLHGMTENGQDANKALSDLGITAVRDRPVWLRLADAAGESGKAGTLLAQTMSDAKQGWIENIELQSQYSRISETTAAKLQVLVQAFEQLLASSGAGANSALGGVVDVITDVIRGFEAIARSDVGQVFGGIGIGAAVVVGAFLLLVGGAARAAAAIQGVGQAIQLVTGIAPRMGAALSTAFRVATIASGIVGLVAALVGLGISIAAIDQGARDAARGMQDFDGLLVAMRQDAENGEKVAESLTYTADAAGLLGKESGKSKQATRDMTEALYGSATASEAAASGLDSATASAQSLTFAYGDLAKEFARSEMLKAPDFKKLFEDYGPGLWDKIGVEGFSIESLDWDNIMEEMAKKGGNPRDALRRSIKRQLGNDAFDVDMLPGGVEDSSRQFFLSNFVDAASRVASNYSDKLSAMIAMNGALMTSTSRTAAEMIDDVSLIDEATQKMADRMAQGFGKFVDPKGLIGLTQEMTRVGEKNEDVAAKFEESWTKAYGGASFKLSDYMTVFKRAGGEQQQFVTGLQTLLGEGVSPAIIEDLAAMGPEAARLVQALVEDVNSNAGAGLAEFESMWGQTGYDSMMKMAVSMKMGEEIINNIYSDLGFTGLQRFNDALASGMGTSEALASMQRDLDGKELVPVMGTPTGATTQAMIAQGMMQVFVDGKPVLVPIKGGKADVQSTINGIGTLQRTADGRPVRVIVKPVNGGGMSDVLSVFRHSAYSNPIMVPVRTYNAGGTGIPGKTMLAGGGYTGPGGKWKEAGVVHAGEFVMTAKATRAIGVDNLYRLMREANSTTYRPSGYANGGAVGGGGSGGMGVGGVVSLSAHDRELLRRLGDISLYIGNEQVMRANHSAGSTNARRGRG